MRVLVLHSHLGVLRGGGENFTRNLFAAFGKLGHHVKAAFVADRNGRYPIPLPSNVEAIPLRGWWSNTLGQTALSAVGQRLVWLGVDRKKWERLQNALDWRTFAWHNRRFQRRIARDLLQEVRASDAVYVHGNPFLASEMARIRPTLLRLPGPLSPELLPVLRTIHAVCANGDALSRIRAFLGTDALELPVGLDSAQFAPGPTDVRAALGWNGGRKVVGYTGRLTKLKGVDLLAETFKEVVASRNDVRLLIVGSGQEDKNIRVTLKRELASGLVHIEPGVQHEELPAWYRAMDLFVMPSRYENYSNALLEAMACRIPFAASDIGGNRVLADSGGGWLFDPNSVPSMVSVLNSALADTDELATRGLMGYTYVQGRYDWTITAKRLEQILCSLSLRHSA
jgi:glycosyltransferase involved in cell wall biosynthesis